MIKKATTCIVIPCYNEGRGISLKEYSSFLDTNPDTMICFVNDGSKDNTLEVLRGLQEKYQSQIHVLDCEKNVGKAEAVRTGINYCNEHFQHQFIGYLDADLATTLEEFIEFEGYMKEDVVFCFGSRIRKIGSTIDRENSRFLIGRIIATFISNILDIKVYDTQCGAKIFTKDMATQLFKKKFISKWLFDVELFYRMKLIFGKEKALRKMLEIPLKQWIEKGDSKVKMTYFFKLWHDLYQIDRRYKSKTSNFI